jgi:uncharacterized UPF0146 family protein
MVAIPRTPAEAVALLRKHADECDHTQTVIRMVADWVTATGIYDPVADTYAIRLPGDVVRRVRRIADR